MVQRGPDVDDEKRRQRQRHAGMKRQRNIREGLVLIEKWRTLAPVEYSLEGD